MNFEDLQKEWKDQFPASAESPAAQAEAQFLAQLKLQKRRRPILAVLRVLTGIAAVAFLCLYAFGAVKYSLFFPPGLGLILMGAEALLMMTATATAFLSLRWGLRLLPSQSSPMLGSVLRIENQRWSRRIFGRNLLGILAMLFLAVVGLSTTLSTAGFYRTLDWVAVILLVISAVIIWGYRRETKAQMPKDDDTLLGALAVRIYQTRRQIRLMASWPLGALAGIAMTLLALKTLLPNLSKGWPSILATILPFLVVVTVFALGLWRINRWVLRSRLQPRLDQLEKLREELSSEF